MCACVFQALHISPMTSFSKLILTLQKMFLGFMQLMAIKEPCWGDTCPFWRDFNCYLLAFLKLFIYFFSVANCALILFDSLGRCWISAVSTVFKQNHRCCKPLLEE